VKRAKELKVLYFFVLFQWVFFGCVVILDGIGRGDFFLSYFFQEIFSWVGWGVVGGKGGVKGFSFFFSHNMMT
jgi:hypothetical protein